MSRQAPSRPLAAFSVSLALLCTAGAAVVAAAARADAPGATPLANPVQRTVVWGGFPPPSDSPRGFWVSSTSVDTPVPDSFQISYNQGTFVLDYQKENASYTAARIAVAFDALVEWNDTAGTGEIENDSILATVPLGATGFGDVPVQHVVATLPDGGEIHYFRIPSNSGEVVLNLTIAERFVRLSNTKTLTPMEAELSVEINHVVIHPNARIGLLLSVQTPGTVRFQNTSWDDDHAFSQGEHSMNVTDASHGSMSSVFFSWMTQAEVNGRAENVTATGYEAGQTNPGTWELYLGYGGDRLPSGASVRVVHDPNLGVVSAAYESFLPITSPLHADYLVYAVTAGSLGAAVVGSVVLAARRRRTK